jgi:nucleoside-diphosphate-sugar epimerase
MKILITGGAGYLGSALISELIKKDSVELTVVDDLSYGQTSLIKYCRHINFIRKDVYDLTSDEMSGFDYIIPLAAIVGAPACKFNEERAWRTNCTSVTKILENCGEAKVIIPTTNSGYGVTKEYDGDLLHCTEETELNPISVYGASKVAAEKAVLDYGGISLRLATVFGLSSRMRMDLLVNDFVYKACRDKYIVLFESHFKRNYIHIQDVVGAFIHCIENYEAMKGQAYNVGLSSANISKLELCRKIQKYIPDFYIEESDINKDPDQRNYIVSNEKIEKTGWKPAYTLDDGIKEIMNAYPIIEKSLQAFGNL